MPRNSTPQQWWEPAIAVGEATCACGIKHKILGTVTSLATVSDKPCLCGCHVDFQPVRDAMELVQDIHRKYAERN